MNVVPKNPVSSEAIKTHGKIIHCGMLDQVAKFPAIEYFLEFQYNV